MRSKCHISNLKQLNNVNIYDESQQFFLDNMRPNFMRL